MQALSQADCAIGIVTDSTASRNTIAFDALITNATNTPVIVATTAPSSAPPNTIRRLRCNDSSCS